jgi:hypothetical protein
MEQAAKLWFSKMGSLMDDYIDELLTKGRLSEDRIYSPLFREEDYQ